MVGLWGVWTVLGVPKFTNWFNPFGFRIWGTWMEKEMMEGRNHEVSVFSDHCFQFSEESINFGVSGQLWLLWHPPALPTRPPLTWKR